MGINNCMHKIYFTVGGGCGDCLNTFFTGDLTYAQSMKEIAPDTEVLVICRSSNASVDGIFTNHPFFNAVKVVSVLGDALDIAIQEAESNGYVHWSQVFDYNQLYRTAQQVFLTPEEEVEVQSISNLGTYIAVHPFNSAGTGIAATHFEVNTDYPRIIKQIIDAGYNVVQVGGDWTHIPTNNIQRENFEYDHPKFINLVNKFNIRMIARTVMNAAKFIGTSSVWMVVAAVTGIPTFMILPVHMADILNDEAATGQGLRGTLIKKQGVFYGAQVPELYSLTSEFIFKNLQKRKLDFTSEYPLLV